MTSVIAHHEITTRDKQVFEALDLNNDGTVSSTYLIQFLKTLFASKFFIISVIDTKYLCIVS